MANKQTIALTKEQYELIINTMLEGGVGFRPNPSIMAQLSRQKSNIFIMN